MEVIDKVSGQWRQLLETEEDPAYPGQLVGFYEDEESDATFILCCATNFTPVYSKDIIFTIHSRFNVSRLASIIDVLERGRILME